MINEYLVPKIEVGTVLKDTFKDEVVYYIVGEYFVYTNDYDYPQIRPHKFDFNEHVTIASKEEREKFITDLKKNHLIWNKNTGKLEREFEEMTLSVKVRTKQGMSKTEVLNTLNNLYKFSGNEDIKNVDFVDF